MKKFLVIGMIFLMGILVFEARGNNDTEKPKAIQLNLILCANDGLKLIFSDNVKFETADDYWRVPFFSIRKKTNETIIEGRCKFVSSTNYYFISLYPKDLKKLKDNTEYILVLQALPSDFITFTTSPVIDTCEYMFGGDREWTIPILVKYTNQNRSSYSLIK